MRKNDHKRAARLAFNIQQLFCKPAEKAWCISGRAHSNVSNM